MKKFDDIFSRLDRMHERDRQTDGQTPDHSKDRAYQARSYVQARGGSCLLVPRRLNCPETQLALTF